MKLQKLDTDESTRVSDKDIEDFENLENQLSVELTRRKAIGARKFAEITVIEKESERNIYDVKHHQECVLALLQEAGKLANTHPDANDSYLRRHFAALAEKLKEIVHIRKLKIEGLHDADKYLLINPSSSQPFQVKELFSDSGTLLRPDLISVSEKTGLFMPKEGSSFLHGNQIQKYSEIETDLAISSSTGICYSVVGNVLLDPGRLKLLVFDDFLTSTSEKAYFIPFIPDILQKCPSVQNPSQFRLWNDVIDPETGLRVPIMAATLIEGELLPVGQSILSSVTGLKVWFN